MLSSASLKNSLQQIFENAAQSGSNPPTEATLAASWADAVAQYAGSIVPACSSPTAAKSALQSGLGGFGQENQAASTMESAFSSFATALGKAIDSTNTLGATTSTSTAPSGSVGFAQVFATTCDDAGQAAQAIADKIHTWMTTGSTILTVSGTAGSPIVWS